MNWRDDYLAACLSRQARKTANTHRRVTEILEEFLSSKGQTIEQCESTTLDDFSGYLMDQQLRPGSVRLYVSSARLYLDWCRERGAPIPAMAKPRLPRDKARLPDPLRESDLDAWLTIVSSVNEPFATALSLLPAIGLRINEHCRLKLSDIDAQVIGAKPTVRFRVSGKSKRERIVPMLPFGVPILGRYLRDIRPGLAGQEYLFPNKAGGPMLKGKVEARIREIRVRLGNDKITAHILRHTYATILAENGVSGFDLAMIMGHEDLKTTGVYVHPAIDRIARQVGAIDYHR